MWCAESSCETVQAQVIGDCKITLGKLATIKVLTWLTYGHIGMILIYIYIMILMIWWGNFAIITVTDFGEQFLNFKIIAFCSDHFWANK